MKKSMLIFCLLCCLISTHASAEDLVQVYQLALKNDPTLLAEYASQQAVIEKKNQSKANFLPSLAIAADAKRNWLDYSSGRNRDSNFNSYGYSLSISQPLYKKQNNITLEQADIAIQQAQAQLDSVQQALIVRVSERYFDVLAKQDDKYFAIAESEAIARQLAQTKLRFDVGLATITDITEAQAAQDLAKASVIAANNELQNSIERLREPLGRYVENVASLKADTELVRPEPEDVEQWSATALQQNPAMLAANLDVENAKQTIELTKSGHYPTLDLVGRQGYDYTGSSGFGSSKQHNTAIGLEFNLPIDVSGRVRSQTREAEYRLNQSMQQQELQRRNLVRQSREAYNGVISGLSRVSALKQAVISSEKALESTEAGFDVGTRTTVDVLNVRRDLFRARRDYASARYQYILSSLRLKQAAGTVSELDIENINQWLTQQ